MPRSNLLRFAVLSVAAIQLANGCSVFSHEAVIDASWDSALRPALLSVYPHATAEELKDAHGYAYGGAIIQDLGYYPHGSKKFSDMTHYVRTGDFLLALIHESQSLDELAFALGALSHYSSDLHVHSSATNPGEAILYPKLERRFGPIVTYEEDPEAHLKTEFGFDVLEIAKGRFAPEAYHDFIGFYVAPDVLTRAFEDTYGINLKQIFPNFERSINSYRRDVSIWIPRATRIAWAQREKDIQKSQPGITRRRFVYVLKRASYEHDWGRDYERPSLLDRILSVLLKIIPPIGPLRALQFKMPTPQVEALFMKSFDASLQQYDRQLAARVKGDALQLGNPNYDLGRVAKPGEYRLQDEAYAFWVKTAGDNHFSELGPEARKEILRYYSDPASPNTVKHDPKKWQVLQQALATLRSEPVRAADSPRTN